MGRALWVNTSSPSQRKLLKRRNGIGAKRAAAPPRRRKRVRSVSVALSKAKRLYRARVRKVLASVKCCCACFERQATEVHHARGRVASLLMDERYWLFVCNPCHSAIHQNPEQARKDGLLCAKGDWNRPGPKE